MTKRTRAQARAEEQATCQQPVSQYYSSPYFSKPVVEITTLPPRPPEHRPKAIGPKPVVSGTAKHTLLPYIELPCPPFLTASPPAYRFVPAPGTSRYFARIHTDHQLLSCTPSGTKPCHMCMNSPHIHLWYEYAEAKQREALLQAKPDLIQEKLSGCTWKLLIAVMLLNKTTGAAAIPIYWAMMNRWPTLEKLASADCDELKELLRPLGLQNMRSQRLINFAQVYAANPPDPAILSRCKSDRSYEALTPVAYLPGTGPYALDSYRIFSSEVDPSEWMRVRPSDKELIRYLRWRWAYEQQREWHPHTGPGEKITSMEYYETLGAGFSPRGPTWLYAG